MLDFTRRTPPYSSHMAVPRELSVMNKSSDDLPQPPADGTDRVDQALRQMLNVIATEDVPEDILRLARQLGEALDRHKRQR